MNKNISPDHELFEGYVHIGQLIKTVGNKGEVLIEIFDKAIEPFMNARASFMFYKGNMLPFFIKGIQKKNDLLKVKFEDIKQKEDVQWIHPKYIFLHHKDISSEFTPEDGFEQKESTPFSDLIGFKCVLRDKTVIGTIIDIQEFPQQIMTFVGTLSGEKMIPLNEQFVLEVNQESKYIILELPEGLLH